MIVFWLLILLLVIAIGCVIAYFCGDFLYDKTKDITKAYIEDTVLVEKEENENEQER